MPRKTSGVRARIDRALRTMEGQHARLNELHRELDRVLERREVTEAQEWLTRLRSALRAHFELEESTVFPALAELHPDAAARTRRLASEHGAALSAVEVLVGAPLETVSGALRELRLTLAAHESDEEEVVREALDGAHRGSL